MAGLVVLHVSDDGTDVPRAISAADLIATREPMRVQIIVNGNAVTALVAGEEDGHAVEPSDGVSLVACEQSLREQGLTPESLREGIGTVPSGVIALARTQHEGAAYIRI